MQHKLPLS